MAESLGADLAGGALDHFKVLVFACIDYEALCQARSSGVLLLVKLNRGHVCTLAPPIQEWGGA